MKKKIKTLHSGFTIVELLISMLIAIVVATALVPVIGPKKVKIPKVAKTHGIYECYWRDGTLYEYYANNRGRQDAPVKALEGGSDHCTFRPPAADGYDIYAIGAGSDGYRDNNVGYSINPERGAFTRTITIRNFNNDFDAIPDALRQQINAIYSNPNNPVFNISAELKTAFDEWAQHRRDDDNEDLYVAFSNLASPLDVGGSGLAKRMVLMDCLGICPNSQQCRDPYPKPGGGRWMSTELPEAMEKTQQADRCMFYVNARGGKSGIGRIMKPGAILLVPVEAPKKTMGFGAAGGFSAIVNDKEVNIRTITSQGEASIILLKKLRGLDAEIKDLGGVKQLYDGQELDASEVYATPAEVIKNPNNLMRFQQGNSTPVIATEARFNEFVPFVDSHRNDGAEGGLERGDGGSAPGQGPTPGRATYTNNAFTWSLEGMKVDYRYGAAGIPGDVNIMTYNNLRGNLYVFPGQSFEDGTCTDTAVVKNLDDKPPIIEHCNTLIPEERENPIIRSQIALAKSYSRRGGTANGSAILNPNNIPNPDPEIVRLATPQNDKFNEIITRIRQSRFRSGLYNCFNARNCPGFAGSGAYPYINAGEVINTLILTDNQELYRRNGSFEKTFLAQVYTGNKPPTSSCRKDCTNRSQCIVNKGQKTFNPGSGGEIKTYDEEYCIPSADTRQDGAVIIIW